MVIERHACCWQWWLVGPHQWQGGESASDVCSEQSSSAAASISAFLHDEDASAVAAHCCKVSIPPPAFPGRSVHKIQGSKLWRMSVHCCCAGAGLWIEQEHVTGGGVQTSRYYMHLLNWVIVVGQVGVRLHTSQTHLSCSSVGGCSQGQAAARPRSPDQQQPSWRDTCRSARACLQLRCAATSSTGSALATQFGTTG